MLVLSIVLLSLLITPIFAQEESTGGNFDTTVSPVFFDFNAKPGQTINDRIRIRNNTNQTQQLTVTIGLLGGDENGELTVKETSDESINWITFEDKTIEALPKEWINIPFSLEVPQNAAYGYYWAISFNSPENKAQDFTGTRLNASLVVPILLNVHKDGAVTDGNIAQFRTDKSWYEYLPVNFLTTFDNTGNVHIKPKGNIFIEDFFGNQVGSLEINDTQGAILPQTKRTFKSIWDDSFIYIAEKTGSDGNVLFDAYGKAQTELKFNFQKILDLRIGRYTATALVVLSTDTNDVAFERSISFFVFPWKIVIGIVIFLILSLLGLITTTKTISRKVGGLFKRFKK